MKKRVLITSTELMMIQFLAPHVENLSENGFEIDLACSNVGGRINEVYTLLEESTKNIFEVNLQRSPLSLSNIKGYKQLKQIIFENHYDMIWTNEPVMGVATRLAAKNTRKQGTKVLYMCHGFHFFDGAPKANWLIFYPIEKHMAKHCDIIATINREDFQAAERFKPENARYLHGIGVNTDRLNVVNITGDIRKELGIDENDFVVVSVGELNENKNQQVIIRALGQVQDKAIHYLLCGKGDQLEQLKTLALQLGVAARVHFLGYRTDVISILSKADLFAFPTRREGLGLAALEAMYCGLPLVTSDARGPVDFMENEKTGFICNADDSSTFARAISRIKADSVLRQSMAQYNREKVKPFCLEEVKTEVTDLMNDVLEV